MNLQCPFCNFIKGKEEREVIIKNDYAFAFLTNTSIVTGHTLISPIRHINSFDNLTEDEIKAVLNLRSIIRKSLIKTFKAQGFNYAWNENKIAGQNVPHFHLHILPRKEGDTGILEYEPRQFLYRPGSRGETVEEELTLISKLIKRNLS